MLALLVILLVGECMGQAPSVPTVISPGLPSPSQPAPSLPPIPSVPTPKNNQTREPQDKFISRPCEVFDLFCIRRYFSKLSKCKEVYRQLPDQFNRIQGTEYYPRVNLTVNLLDIFYSGFKGRIESFYINKKTNRLLLAISYTNLFASTNTAYFRFHRSGAEPIVLKGFYSANFDSVIITIVIPNLKELEFRKSEVSAFVDGSFSSINLTPNEEPTDPGVVATLVDFNKDQYSNVQEALSTDAPYIIGNFIQNSICDFGLRVL